MVVDASFAEALSDIQSQYLAAVALNRFDWKDILNTLTWDNQQELLNQTVGLALVHKYPLQTKYSLRFMRHIINHLESQNDEVHDDLYAIFCEYQAKDASNEKFSYRHFKVNEFTALVTLKEANSNITDGTTGLSVWDAAMALAEWAISHRSHFDSTHVVELGSGTGLCGMLMAKICRLLSITLTDGNDKVLDCLRQNVQNNFDDHKYVRVKDLDWNEIAYQGGHVDFDHEPNIIVASDIVFDGADAGPLCTTLHKIFARYGDRCELILANAMRNADTQKKFFDKLAEFHFNVTDLVISPPKHLYWTINTDCPINLYRITRTRPSE